MSDRLPKIIQIVVEALAARGFSESESMQMLGKIQKAKSILTYLDQKMIQAAYKRGYRDGFNSGKAIDNNITKQTYLKDNHEQFLANLRAQQAYYKAQSIYAQTAHNNVDINKCAEDKKDT